MSDSQKIIAIARKDILHEYRSRETVSTMLLFSFLVVVIFNFTFDPGSTFVREAVPGIMWVAFTFSGILGLGRSFSYEVDKGSLQGLLLTPADRGAIYIGKMIGNVLFISVVELLTLPFVIVFFNLNFWEALPKLLPVMFFATMGFSAVGTLFSAMSVNTRTREILLPILLFPVVVPVILAAVNATAAILNEAAWPAVMPWLQILLAFDAIFIALCYLLFDYVVEE